MSISIQHECILSLLVCTHSNEIMTSIKIFYRHKKIFHLIKINCSVQMECVIIFIIICTTSLNHLYKFMNVYNQIGMLCIYCCVLYYFHSFQSVKASCETFVNRHKYPDIHTLKTHRKRSRLQQNDFKFTSAENNNCRRWYGW